MPPPTRLRASATGTAPTTSATAAPAPTLDHNALHVAEATAETPDWLDSPTTDPQTVILPSDPESSDEADTLPPSDLEPRLPEAVVASASQSSTDAPEVSFLRGDQQESIWRRPVVRIGLIVVLLALLAFLAAQILLKERDRVAAVQPAMLPVLQALCVAAGCSVSPLRQIESVLIDSSSFSRVRGDDYRLGFSLKNTAAIDIAMPAIELSLTDPQDQPIVRRVIQPTDFGARSAALAAASVWTGSLALTVQPGAGSDRIAGYRLLAFYP